ncbi:MAG: DUF4143 domain-containing protein, partial [Patescibacteria group bacterium]
WLHAGGDYGAGASVSVQEGRGQEERRQGSDQAGAGQAKEDPKGLLCEEKPTIVDEVQRCPDLLLTIKYLVDKSRRKRQFILSGSGNISLRKAPRETLAGRAKYLHLTGFGLRERQESPPRSILDELLQDRKIEPADVKNTENLLEMVWRGGLPGVVLASSDKVALERMGSYVDTYIQRDIQDLMKMRHPQNFRRLMTALAQTTGWESVQEELSKVCGEKRSNVSRHMSLLKDTNLLYELKGYAGKGERSYKQSKYFWFDSGAACFLSGVHSPKDLKKPHLKGRYFENFILQEILAWGTLQVIPPEVFYWRPRAGGIEVDFVICSNGKVVGVEVKSAENITYGDTRAMREFLKFHPEASNGIIVYGGNKIYPIASNIYAVPWMAF